MSTLYFRGTREEGKINLCRRHHDLGGTDYEYIASIPREAKAALEMGGSIQIRLRDNIKGEQAPWSMSVRHNDTTIPVCFLGDDRLSILLAEKDRIPVEIEDEKLSFAKRDLYKAEMRAEEAQKAYAAAIGEVTRLEEWVQDLSRNTGLQVATDDGKYTVVMNANDEPQALRYGETWRSLIGEEHVLTLASDLQSARKTLEDLGEDPKGSDGADIIGEKYSNGDVMRVALSDGTTIVQDARFNLRLQSPDGSEKTLIGDNLVLRLAYDLEEAKIRIARLQPQNASRLEM